VARFVRFLSVLSAALALTNGCGVVTGEGFTVAGDAGVIDGPTSDGALTASSDASSCQPADVEAYVPGAYHPATAAYQGACTGDQISAFYAACLDPTTAAPAACRAFSDADAPTGGCAACILTPDSAPAYGPLIDHGTFITSNVAGCIQLTLPGELSCAKAEAALGGCELAACEANCPVAEGPSAVASATRAAYDGCASAADSSGCQSYAQMAACAASLADEDASPAAVCTPQSFKDFYYDVVPLFCASAGEAEAGTALVDAASDSAARPEAGSDSGGRDGGLHDATTEQ